ncbi:MAG TPA: DUF6527 family protein [Rhizobiaceae bacterium]|nr:DUF6527 family protein [Rhizobiaceae bacterium]
MGARGVLRTLGGGLVAFWCPGCKELHQVRVRPAESPSWDFDGNYDRPTFSPSILVRSGHFVPGHKPGDSCWCTYCAEDDAAGTPGFSCKQCHSFVRDGHIQFLGDCSHALAGQTVPLQPIDAGGE